MRARELTLGFFGGVRVVKFLVYCVLLCVFTF
jgi:hypothetical protein